MMEYDGIWWNVGIEIKHHLVFFGMMLDNTWINGMGYTKSIRHVGIVPGYGWKTSNVYQTTRRRFWSENAGPAFMAMLKDKKYEPLDLEVPYFWTKPSLVTPESGFTLNGWYTLFALCSCVPISQNRENNTSFKTNNGGNTQYIIWRDKKRT